MLGDRLDGRGDLNLGSGAGGSLERHASSGGHLNCKVSAGVASPDAEGVLQPMLQGFSEVIGHALGRAVGRPGALAHRQRLPIHERGGYAHARPASLEAEVKDTRTADMAGPSRSIGRRATRLALLERARRVTVGGRGLVGLNGVRVEQRQPGVDSAGVRERAVDLRCEPAFSVGSRRTRRCSPRPSRRPATPTSRSCSSTTAGAWAAIVRRSPCPVARAG
jgi:hypothetical protein